MVVASIVAGEVGSSVPDARMLVACQVVRDAERGRYLPSRWYGWRMPTAADVAAARRALYTDYCDAVPPLRFLGNASDLRVWCRMGYVDAEDAILRMRGDTGAVVVGVLEQTWTEWLASRGWPVPE
jgi:hypothetical protein